MNEKKCSRCGWIKKIEEFGKDKHSSDSYTHWCKSCKNSASKISYEEMKKNGYYEKNKINTREHEKNYRKKNRDKYNEKHRKRYHNNLEKERERAKLYYYKSKGKDEHSTV